MKIYIFLSDKKGEECGNPTWQESVDFKPEMAHPLPEAEILVAFVREVQARSEFVAFIKSDQIVEKVLIKSLSRILVGPGAPGR